jgi:hypothetical protein
MLMQAYNGSWALDSLQFQYKGMQIPFKGIIRWAKTRRVRIARRIARGLSKSNLVVEGQHCVWQILVLFCDKSI